MCKLRLAELGAHIGATLCSEVTLVSLVTYSGEPKAATNIQNAAALRHDDDKKPLTPLRFHRRLEDHCTSSDMKFVEVIQDDEVGRTEQLSSLSAKKIWRISVAMVLMWFMRCTGTRASFHWEKHTQTVGNKARNQ